MDPESTPTEQPQGGEGGSGLYDLEAVPAEVRPLVEQELKKVEARVTPRFQEHAEYRKRWEPFEAVEGLTDVPPEELGQLLAFRQLTSDPEQFANWYYQVGQEMGLLDATPEEGGVEGEGEGPDRVAALGEQLLSALDQRLAPIEQHFTEAEQQSRQQAAEQQIREELSSLGVELDDEARDAVLRLAFSYGGEPGSIQQAFEHFQKIRGAGQSELVQGALDQPGSTNGGGGRPDTNPEEFAGIGDPALKAAVRARFAAAGGSP